MESMEDPVEKEEAKAQKKKSRYPFWLLALLIVCFGGFIALLLKPDNKTPASSLVLNQLEAIKNKNYTEAYYAFTSKEFQKKYPLSAFNQTIKSHPLITLPINVEVDKVEETPKHSAVEVSLSDKQGLALTLRYLLSKENDEWKVSDWSIDNMSGTLFEDKESAKIRQSILSYIKDLEKDDLDKAYYDHSTKALRDSASLEQYRNLIKKYPILKEQAALRIRDIAIHEGQATIELEPKASSQIHILIEMLYQNGAWLVDNIHIVDPQAEGKSASDKDGKTLSRALNQHLSLIKEGQIEEAYMMLSNGFKFATSLDEFTLFLHAYPFIQKHNSVAFNEYFDGGLGKIRAGMKTGNKTNLVDYTLALEDGDWKIWGFEVLSENQAVRDKVFNWQPVLETIQGQKNAIKMGSFHKAYVDFTAAKFRESTSFAEFVDFLKTHPFFKKMSEGKIKSKGFENNVAIILEEFSEPNGEVRVVEYHLVKESGEWKILTMKTHFDNETGANTTPPTTITSLKIGLDPPFEGKLKSHSSILPPIAGPLYGLLNLKNARPLERIEISLKHEETESPTRHFSLLLPNAGDVILPLVFSSPEGFWPTGHYTVEIFLLNGEKEFFAFQIK